MTIQTIKGSNLIADKGTDHGVSPDMEFSIIRLIKEKEDVIGKAKVLVAKNNRSGLRVTVLHFGEKIKTGDRLRAISVDEVANDYSLLQETERISDQTAQTSKLSNPPISPSERNTISSEMKFQDLENRIQEQEKKNRHNSGLIAGIGICCGIYVLASLVLYAGAQENR